MEDTGLPSKAEIFDYWKDRLGKLDILIDWGEPGCWACDFHYGAKYDVKTTDATTVEVVSLWNAIPLQRCHIIPRSLGGDDTCSNLFLMCRECHDLAPNTSIPGIFLRWAKNQSYFKRESQRIYMALDSLGIGEDSRSLYLEVMQSGRFKEWSSGKASLHFPQNKYPPKTCRLTTSTLIGLAQHYIESEFHLGDR